MSKDIAVVALAPGAVPKVIGDIHGSHDELKALLDSLEPGAHLFIAGDLVDKGKDSIAVIKLLSSPENRARVSIVRGNHEDMCLNAISGLESLTAVLGYLDQSKEKNAWPATLAEVLRWIKAGRENFPFVKLHLKLFVEQLLVVKNADEDTKVAIREVLEKAVNSIFLHGVLNVGWWLVDQYMKELHPAVGTIRVSIEPESEKIAIDYEETKSEIRNIKLFMEDLPTIILVPGEKPFLVVHAAMPISDEELFELLKSGAGLTEQQKEYAMCARPARAGLAPEVTIGPKGRHKDSLFALVGHNIVKEALSAVYEDINTVDIDVAAYLSKNFIVVNMSTYKAEVLGPHASDSELALVLKAVNKQLQREASLRRTPVVLSESKTEARLSVPVAGVAAAGALDTPRAGGERKVEAKLAGLATDLAPVSPFGTPRAAGERKIEAGSSESVADTATQKKKRKGHFDDEEKAARKDTGDAEAGDAEADVAGKDRPQKRFFRPGPEESDPAPVSTVSSSTPKLKGSA